MAVPLCAKQHTHLSAVRSRIGKSNQIKKLHPFDTDCPIWLNDISVASDTRLSDGRH
jgi:hypothetical protein